MNELVEHPVDQLLISKIDPEKKVDILLSVAKEITDQLHHLENTANKVTLFVCSGVIVGPILLLNKIKPLPLPAKFGASMTMILIGLSAIWFLHRNREHVQWLRRATIRIQQFLGLYTPNGYMGIDQNTHDLWVKEPVVFPIDSQRWGQHGWLETHMPYFVAIILSTISGVVIVLTTKFVP